MVSETITIIIIIIIMINVLVYAFTVGVNIYGAEAATVEVANSEDACH